jgi:hypothetical protein
MHHAGEGAIFATLEKQNTTENPLSMQISFGKKQVFAAKTRQQGRGGVLSTPGSCLLHQSTLCIKI